MGDLEKARKFKLFQVSQKKWLNEKVTATR